MEAQTVDKLTNPIRLGPKDIPIEAIVSYALQELTDAEIGHLVGCSKQNINQRLSSAGFKRSSVEIFKKNRADIQAFIQSRITGKQIDFLASDESKIEDWPDYKLASVSKAVEVDKEVVTINQFGTVNVQINAVDDKIEALKAKLASRNVDPNEVNSVIDVDNVDNLCKDNPE